MSLWLKDSREVRNPWLRDFVRQSRFMGWFDAGPDAWLLTMACWTNTSLYSIVLTNTRNTNSQWPTLFTVVICSIQIQIHPMHHYLLALPSLIHSTKDFQQSFSTNCLFHATFHSTIMITHICQREQQISDQIELNQDQGHLSK